MTRGRPLHLDVPAHAAHRAGRAGGSLEYAHARLCARFGERPDEALWRRIEVTRELAGVLAIVRGSSLAPYVAGVPPGGDAHAIDAATRRHWQAQVAQVAAWMPQAWQPAVRWCAVLGDLPALAQLGRRDPLPDELADDPRLQALAGAASDPTGDAAAALLRIGGGDATRLLALWRAHWHAVLPEPLAAHPLLQRLVQMLDEHAQRFARAHPADAWPLRRGLAGRVILLFRRAGVDPAQAFAWLTLAALDCERLRAELVPRALLPRRTLAA